MVDFELTEDGPIHLVVGGSGNREGHAGASRPVGQSVIVCELECSV